MKPTILTMLIGLSVILGSQGAARSQSVVESLSKMGQETTYEGKSYICATNAYELVLAIAAGRDVLVPHDTVIDLTPLVIYTDWWKDRGAPFLWLPSVKEADITGPAIVSEEAPYRRQLCLVGISDISIVGEGNSRIVTDASHSFCLDLVRCHNITLRNLIIGHAEGPCCDQSVIRVLEGSGISIVDCELRGCSYAALTLVRTSHFAMRGSSVHDFNGGMIYARDVDSAQFDGCRFYRNWAQPPINSQGSDLTFSGCTFYANDPAQPLFKADREFGLTDCLILHPAAQLGTIELARQSGTQLYEPPGTGSATKVKCRSQQPTVTDLVTALIPAGADALGCYSWAKGWKQYLAGAKGADAATTYTVDRTRGFARIETAGGADTLSYHDFRVWDCSDGRHLIIGHSSGTLVGGKALETPCSGLSLYSYDPATGELTYRGFDRQLLDRPMVWTHDIVYRLSPDSPDIIYIDGDGKADTLRWWGCGFGDSEPLID